MNSERFSLDSLQRLASAMMASLILLTFIGVQAQVTLWQSSSWLVSAVLPGVIVSMTNDKRDDMTTPPLKHSKILDEAATKKAQHMAKHQYFAHYAPDGTAPWAFFSAAGYTYAHAGENLAIYFSDSAAVVEAWMDSPAHRENIINHEFTEIGVGTAKGRYQGVDTIYIVQLFGTPAAPKGIVETLAVTGAPISPPTSQPKEILPVALPSSTTKEVVSVPPLPESSQNVVPQRVSEVPPVGVLVDTVDNAEANEIAATDRVIEDPTTKEPDTLVVASASTTTPALIETPVVRPTALMTISSGLLPIPVAYAEEVSAGATLPSVMTRPQLVLQTVYGVLAFAIIVLLVASIIHETRRRRVWQISYSCLLLGLLVGLAYLHLVLTTNVTIA